MKYTDNFCQLHIVVIGFNNNTNNNNNINNNTSMVSILQICLYST